MSYGLPPHAKGLRELLSKLNGDAARSVQRTTEALLGDIDVSYLQRQIAALTSPALEAWQLKVPKLPLPKLPEYQQQLAAIARRWHEDFLAAQPQNWRDLNDEDKVLDIVEHIRQSRVCLVWLPRATVLREVLDADPEDAKAVLLRNRSDVIDDALMLIGACQDSGFDRERNALREAIEVFRGGHSRAAQALAACVFTSTCHVLFEHGGTGRIARDMRETDPEDATITQLRIRSIFLTSAQALEKFNPVAGKPTFGHFNRHNTVHRITDPQFTDANALSAIVLATALLREIEEWPDAA